MNTSATKNAADVWRLDTNQATLTMPNFSGHVDLLNPGAGLHELMRGDVTIAGTVLGVTPGVEAKISPRDISDAYVRGNDLIVTYAETKSWPFSLQVYWRATGVEQQVIVLDSILSLQTDLLESFPGIAVETRLPRGKCVEITVEGTQHQRATVATLFRATGAHWSYAEMTHPEDRGESEITRGETDQLQLRRQLGGHFLEKGVIRRLRVRGVFLPQVNDTETACKYLAGLVTEEPPLTV